MIEIFFFDGKKVQKAKSLDETKNSLVWVDVTNITKDEETQLKDHFNLHPLSAEDLYNHNIRIKVEEFNEYLLCVFYGLKKEKQIELYEVDYVLGKNFLITNHKQPVKDIIDLKNDFDKLEFLFGKGVDFLFHRILDVQIDEFFPVLEHIDDSIEKIEEQVTKRIEQDTMSKILSLKRQVVKIKKSSLPQRDKLSMLAKNDHPFISKKAVPYFRDIYDHSIKVSDAIDNYREGIGSTFDAYMSAMSNNMNEVMKVLSIIATIALPLSVISGIYGTNFTILPGAGFIYGFWTMIGFMALMMLGMLFFFKKRKWI